MTRKTGDRLFNATFALGVAALLVLAARVVEDSLRALGAIP